jgi:hypothetical protein
MPVSSYHLTCVVVCVLNCCCLTFCMFHHVCYVLYIERKRHLNHNILSVTLTMCCWSKTFLTCWICLWTAVPNRKACMHAYIHTHTHTHTQVRTYTHPPTHPGWLSQFLSHPQLEDRGSIPGAGNVLLSSPPCPDGSGTRPNPYTMGTGGSFAAGCLHVVVLS